MAEGQPVTAPPGVGSEVPAAIVAADPDGRVRLWSAGAQDMFGWTAAEAVGVALEGLRLLPSPADVATIPGLAGEGMVLDRVVPLYHRDGRRLSVRARVQADPAGGWTAVVLPALPDERREGRALDRLALLSRAGALLARALSVQSVVAAIAELAVPALADHCMIDLRDSSGRLYRAVSRHDARVLDPGDSWARPGEVVSYPPAHPVSQVLASGAGYRVVAPTSEEIRRAAPNPVSGGYAERVGIASALSVPLTARGRLRGVLSLAASVSGRVYDEADLSLAEEIGRRAALALDTARLYEQERTTSLTLQRSLLPQSLPEVDGLAFACRYVPGGRTQAGGDWFDVVELSAGRLALVVGDVQGRGARAAAVMGQLRAAVRAYARLDLPPAEILGNLDGLVQALDEVQLVTCIYGVYDPFTRELLFAVAGHLPPLLFGQGHWEQLEAPPGTPLGVGWGDMRETRCTLSPGQGVALFTDGLVERRQEDLEAGVRELGTRLARHANELEVAADAVMGLLPETSADDAALLLAQVVGPRLPSVEVTLASEQPVREARRLLARTLQEWELSAHFDTAALIVSELVTNAVRHARRPADAGADRPLGGDSDLAAEVNGAPVLRLRRGRQALWVEVGDSDLRLPRLRHARADDEGGRGLFLVDAFSERWGARPLPGGKAVWCQLSLSVTG